MPDGPEQEERDQLAVSQLRDQRPGYPFYWCALALSGKFSPISDLRRFVLGLTPPRKTLSMGTMLSPRSVFNLSSFFSLRVRLRLFDTLTMVCGDS